MNKKVTEISNFDFGFSFADDHQEIANQAAAAANDAQSKAEAIFNAIMPFLNNLKKNPDKPNIYWPNRVDKIDEFIDKLQNILNQG